MVPIEELPLIKVSTIKNENGCTNIGGIALASNKKLYAIKTKQDNLMSTIYTFNDYEKENSYTTKKYTNKLLHGNGLAYGNGLLAIPPCGYSLTTINVNNNWERIKYRSAYYISAIAYLYNNVWIVRSHDKIMKIKINYNDLFFDNSYKVENPMAEKGFTVSQDIGYKSGKLYQIYSNESKTKNCIIVSQVLDRKLETIKIYVSKESKKLYEWESLAIDNNGKIIIAANTAKGDFLYRSKDYVVSMF